MSQKTGKKIGFISALAMLVGSVVGIGIFFKSHGILRSNDWNGTGTFLAWLMGGILSLAAAVSFSEISSMKTKRVHGLAAWAERVGGKKFGYFVRFNYSFFYFGLLAAVLGVFGSEMLFNMIATFSSHSMSDFPIYAHIIVGLAIVVMFLGLNYMSAKAGGYVQTVSTVLKWIPLLIVGLAGVILATTNNADPATRFQNAHDAWVAKPVGPAPTLKDMGHLGENAFTNGVPFKFTGMLAALPAVLFAFDAFLNVGSMRGKMKEPKKLPMVVIVGMVSVLVLYMIIALAAILHGSGMVSGAPFGQEPGVGLGIFDQIFSTSVAEAMGKMVVVFLLISTLGVINGMSAAAIAAHEQALETNTIFGAKTAIKKFGFNKTLLGYSLLLTVFWTLVFGIPAIVLNSDSIVDGVSNFPTLFFFVIYGTTIFLYTIKRSKFKDTKKMNNVVFNIFAWTAIVGIAFVVGYQLFYGFTINAIQNPTDTTHWGLFAGDGNNDGKLKVNFPTKNNIDFGVYISNLQSMFIFVIFLMVFVYVPKLNATATKAIENNDVYIDSFKEVKATKKA